jgi:hypothetical protein
MKGMEEMLHSSLHLSTQPARVLARIMHEPAATADMAAPPWLGPRTSVIIFREVASEGNTAKRVFSLEKECTA